MIHYFGYPGFEEVFEFYNIVGDPWELVDLYALHDPMAARFQDEIKEKLSEIDANIYQYF
jgi:hypothetical protein